MSNTNYYSSLYAPPNPECFNCLLPAFECYNYANCSSYSGKCICPPGFGGDDCSNPLCDSLPKKERMKRPPDQKSCTCDEGWSGINCNLCETDAACNPMMEVEGQNGTCYKGAITVKNSFVQCDVTNPSIGKLLGDQTPQATLSCEKVSNSCSFQFWSAEEESFYCKLTDCKFEQDIKYDKNITSYDCNQIECKCYPGRLLCGKDGSVDLTEWFESKEEGPVGPALFQCHEDQTTIGRGKRNCKFSELNMNKLIGQLIGDPYISLNCTSSECLHYSQLPNYVRPDAASGFSPLIMFLTFGGAVILFLICLITFIRQVRSSESDVVAFDNEEHIPLNPNMDIDDRRRFMMAGHVPCSLAFRDLCYVVDVTKKKKELADEVDQVRSQQGSQLHVLEGIEGIVKSGEVMAIMGGSGAGKTSCLDILAKRQKSGVVSGDILVNGKAINTSEYKSIIGYVDQEDTLMDTLTVSETIMYSALLRLPPHMSQESKKYRVYETMQELGILHIANRRIGSSGSRGISGGEKRRVSIACELVTSPSVLFLDEPTSGLDSYNAYNVIECLVSLSRNYQRTVIFTIHQPRSNIYALFDKLLLLAKGKVVYSGPAQETVIDHFSSIGYTCPLGFNIADYLVDLTMHVVNSSDSPENKDDVIEIDDKTNGKLAASKINIKAQQESILFTPRQQTLKKEANKGKENISDSHDAFSLAEGNSHDLLKENNKSKSLSVNNKSMNGSRSNSVNNITEIKDHLEHLIQSFKNSAISKENQSYFLQYEVAPGNLEQQLGSDEDVDEANHNSFKTIKKAFSLSFINGENGNFFNNLHIYGSEKHIDWFTQFKILSDRTFKNLYRNPALLQTQYVLSVIAAIACGTLYYKLSTDIAGFQNRMGAFLFICALLGFGCLSSMPAFASERLIFVKERANSYYKPVTYFSSKVLFDIIPLRVVPPVILGLIIYHMMGLRTESPVYLLKFLFALVLFNLTAASLCFFISIVFKDSGVANLIATLIMLFQMLFGGILLNKKSIPSGLSWLNTVSFYNLAVEALVVNEVNGLALYENKLGLMIDVPGAVVLDMFGFEPLAYWRDITSLFTMIAIFLILGFLWLQFMVKEKK